LSSRFQEMEQRYHELQKALAGRSLSQARFEEEVIKLRFEDEKGTWWQLDGTNGSWLKWDGASWLPAGPEESSQLIPHDSGKEGFLDTVPDATTSIGFLKQFAVCMGTSLEKELPWMVLASLLIFFSEMALLILFSSGKGNGAVSPLSAAIVMPGNIIEGMVFWALLAWIIATLIRYIRGQKAASPLHSITGASIRVGDAIHGSGSLFLPVFIIGILTALIAGSLPGNAVIPFQLALVSSGWLLAEESSMILFAGLIWKDLAGPRTPAAAAQDSRTSLLYTGLFGLVIGFFISVFTHLNSYIPAIVVSLAAFVVATAIISRRRS
jgi:hypothetical protein